MKKAIFLLLLTAVTCLFLSGVCLAKDEELAPGFTACMEKAKIMQEVMACAADGIDHWDKELGERYAAAKKDVLEDEERGVERMERLDASMAAWKAYYEATKVFLANESPNSSDRMPILMFMLESARLQALTITR